MEEARSSAQNAPARALLETGKKRLASWLRETGSRRPERRRAAGVSHDG
jgi:hypothetical protein